jgi:hypothetical protein
VESVVKGKSLFASAIAQPFKMFCSTECMKVAKKLTSGMGNHALWYIGTSVIEKAVVCIAACSPKNTSSICKQ